VGILDLFSLEGRAGFVTGAAKGVGRGIAGTLAEAGARVAVADVDGEGAERAAAEIARTGGECIAVRADVTKAEEVERLVEAVLSRWGRLDVAVNNAGICRNSAAEQTPRAEWDAVIALDLTSVFLCCQAAGRRMIAQGSGSIVNIASMSARVVNFPQPQAAYNAAKAGVVQLTKSLAVEWAARGVRVNCISPGYVNTDMLKPVPQMHPAWLERTPLRRFAEPWEVGGLAVYLASDASAFCTGSDFLIDGGYTLW
jgi:NAD(P)-dependent dehydrogenase (short-subunit alcohol dehydrogenase family)